MEVEFNELGGNSGIVKVTINQNSARKNRDRPTEVYLPANQILDDLTVVLFPGTRIYDFGRCEFRITFNAARCHLQSNHIILLSFFDYWIPPELLEKRHLLDSAFIFEKKPGQDIEDVQMSGYYVYNITSTRPANTERASSGEATYALRQGHTIVNIEKNSTMVTKLSFSINGSSSFGSYLELKLNTSTSKYFALFANNMLTCPTFISSIYGDFDVWLANDEIEVEGYNYKDTENITVLRDVILGGAVILSYYYFLNYLILPVYFNFDIWISENWHQQKPETIMDIRNSEGMKNTTIPTNKEDGVMQMSAV
ncbi:hypothetical protein DICVIV_06313 [Dictyocaulus viviparus]|uniref:Uncharacterized protein n=1 Tax=Dictyocaulus viviparus TaxID=29172 RepID=A0A0D8XZ23_DICVI|nr:hypothetical protein DICVIV_06313 [Dictyocaulus viviparus]